jgi:hypothetical protein
MLRTNAIAAGSFSSHFSVGPVVVRCNVAAAMPLMRS